MSPHDPRRGPSGRIRAITMATTMAQPKVCCVIGAGDGTASAVARRFAGEGYTVCLARRTVAALQPLLDRITNAGGHVRAYALDARRGDQVVGFFDRIEAEVGAVDAVVLNVGGNLRFPILETTAQKYFKVWEMCALAGFLAGREAALRALAQAMARVLGPKGLHVAHVVIDGLIYIAFSREHFAQRVIEAESDGILNSDHVADAFWWLHNQPRDAWTFELDLRPAAERW